MNITKDEICLNCPKLKEELTILRANYQIETQRYLSTIQTLKDQLQQKDNQIIRLSMASPRHKFSASIHKSEEFKS